MTQRIDQTFAALSAASSTAFVAYIMGGDPDRATSQAMLNALPENGVDIIELGMPFTDPAADGPTIEEPAEPCGGDNTDHYPRNGNRVSQRQ